MAGRNFRWLPTLFLIWTDFGGLCKETRLIITRMKRYVLEVKVISGSCVGDIVFIPRLSLEPRDMRISLKNVGVYLPTHVFSHGKLYVAISSVTSIEGLKILITDW
ncbi:PIF1 helicase, putative [Medicago truncatula]|uniref:PIF1 helicase, putative n=1 Tax=Medicago truncatula TaxID=3880 RepID=G7IC48_MEDTR|nr:PIF1 helicase, putative [Medicago truncatula]